jgi:hypothetical protein
MPGKPAGGELKADSKKRRATRLGSEAAGKKPAHCSRQKIEDSIMKLNVDRSKPGIV